MKLSKGLALVASWAAISVSSITLAAPGGVTDPGFWIKADDAGSNFSENWDDHSPNNNAIGVVAPSSNPWTLSGADASHNFHEYTTGYSSNRFFYENDSFLSRFSQRLDTELTAVAVTRMTSYSESDARIIGIDNESSGAAYAAEPSLSIAGSTSNSLGATGTAEFYKYYNFPSETRNSSAVVPLSQMAITHFRVGGSNLDQLNVGVNGNETSYTLNDSLSTYANNIFIGYGRWGQNASGTSGIGRSGAFPGDINEVILFPKNLSTNELRRVNTYLAVKYGVTIPGNYLSASGTTIWNSGLASSYGNNIFRK